MVNRINPPVLEPPTETQYAELEAQIVSAVADFGLEELQQLADAAEAIRRVRRL